MGRKMFIDETDDSIAEICWTDKRGEEEGIKSEGSQIFKMTNSEGDYITLFKEDLPKLKAAIDKAIELKWHLEGE